MERKNRQVPGMENVGNIRFGNKQPINTAFNQTPRATKLSCPLGHECKNCKMAVNVNGKVKCSLTVIAKKLLEKGIEIVKK